MAKVTPGFKLYLYQLLSREVGMGKQTLLPQVEEVLRADDIIPQDLECETVQELVEACPDFLKLTVFKKGRAYATVLRNEEWDRMLEAADEKPADAGKAPKKAVGGPKAWKKRKAGKKTFKPVKPGKQRRDREAAEAQAAAERAEQEAREAAERAEQERLAAEEAAREEKAAPVEPISEELPEEPVDTDVAPDSPAEEMPAPSASTARTLAEVLAEARAAEEAEAVAEPEPVAAPEPEPAPEPAPEPEAEPEPEPAPEPEAEPVPEPPLAPEPAPISLTITYDPYEDMERELAQQREEALRSDSVREPESVRKPEPAREPLPAVAPATSPAPPADLPQDFAQDVSCKDALLRAIYHLLPYDVDPMAVLDEDWRVARSTGSLTGSRNRVSFPLRYVHEDGTPIMLTLRKSARNASGRRWSLLLVDGDDGTGISHEAVGFDGLPTADEGAWNDLSPQVAEPNPVREFVQQVVIGSWDSLLGSLATLAAPERWNYPGEGVGRQSRYGILREYLALTFHRAQCQERIARSSDGSFAAFCTGLVTSFGDDIYACMTARKGDIPWKFAGFATAGSGELGARLAGTISPLPEQPTYLSSLECVTPTQGRMVILDLDGLVSQQLGRLPRAFLADLLEGNAEAGAILAGGSTLSGEDLTRLGRIIRQDAGGYRRLRRRLDDAVTQAMRSMRASYRLAVPVYDPTENRTKLLAPLNLVDEGTTDCALVLDLQPSGAYRAAAVLPLPRAYACARVISREQPAWLAAERVLRG